MRKSDAIRFFGSAAELARRAGISRAAVSKWDEFVPELTAYRLERLTNGALKVDPTCYQIAESLTKECEAAAS